MAGAALAAEALIMAAGVQGLTRGDVSCCDQQILEAAGCAPGGPIYP
jgi:hypothetical protein